MLSICHRLTGAQLCSADAPTLAGASLRGAQLADAELPFAVLHGAERVQ